MISVLLFFFSSTPREAERNALRCIVFSLTFIRPNWNFSASSLTLGESCSTFSELRLTFSGFCSMFATLLAAVSECESTLLYVNAVWPRVGESLFSGFWADLVSISVIHVMFIASRLAFSRLRSTPRLSNEAVNGITQAWVRSNCNERRKPRLYRRCTLLYSAALCCTPFSAILLKKKKSI